MTADAFDCLWDAVGHAVATDAAVVEQACEEALQGGECGVLVVYRDGRVVTARPDASVPYGWRHEHR